MEQALGVAERIHQLVEQLEAMGVELFLIPGKETWLKISLEKGYPSDPQIYIGMDVSLEKLAENLDYCLKRWADK